MEPRRIRSNYYVDYRDAPFRFGASMGIIKKRFGYQSNKDVPWIFRSIPNALEKCISIEISPENYIKITYNKYKYGREATLLKIKDGREVEGYFEVNNYVSTKGYFYRPSVFREFNEIETKTLTIPNDLCPELARREALELLCDGDNFLVPREFVPFTIIIEMSGCFLSAVAIDYLMIIKSFRFFPYFQLLINSFKNTVLRQKEVNFYFASIENTGRRRLAFIKFRRELYLLKFLYDTFNSGVTFEEYPFYETREIRTLPHMTNDSSDFDFEIDIDFNNYSILHTNSGLIAIPIQYDFLQEINFREVFDNEKLAKAKKNYQSCDVFLFKSSWRFFLAEDKIPETCMICLLEFTDNDLVKRFGCQKHLFHCKCIDEWFAEKCVCPLCKYDISLGIKEDDDEKELKVLMKKRSHK